MHENYGWVYIHLSFHYSIMNQHAKSQGFKYSIQYLLPSGLVCLRCRAILISFLPPQRHGKAPIAARKCRIMSFNKISSAWGGRNCGWKTSSTGHYNGPVEFLCDWVTYFWSWCWLLFAEVIVGVIAGLHKHAPFFFAEPLDAWAVNKCLETPVRFEWQIPLRVTTANVFFFFFVCFFTSGDWTPELNSHIMTCPVCHLEHLNCAVYCHHAQQNCFIRVFRFFNVLFVHVFFKNLLIPLTPLLVCLRISESELLRLDFFFPPFYQNNHISV